MDADWEHFAIHFDKVHNDFFISLKKHHRNLTPNELKLCAYLRMNLCTKEVARLMNISVRGVEISRYRLRKKLQLPTETNLTTYLLDLHAELQD
jgi:DNA-binding CsgD family transcriptional regulator